MPGTYKVTFFFVSGKTGWSESYYCQQANSLNAMLIARSLAQRRVVLCGIGVDLAHIRVSDLSIRGDAVYDGLPGYTTRLGNPNAYTSIGTAEPNLNADVSWTSALITYTQQNVVKGRTFMRGLPDDFFTNDRVFDPSANWKTAFKAFAKEYLDPTNVWGFLRKPSSTAINTRPITQFTVLANGTLSITSVFVPPTPVNGLVAVRGAKTSKGVLSGTFTVLSVMGGDYVLDAKIRNLAPVPTWVEGTGTAQNADPTFVTGLLATFDREATTRHAGRPFGALVGRRKKVAALR